LPLPPPFQYGAVSVGACQASSITLTAQHIIDALTDGSCPQLTDLASLITCCGDPTSPLAAAVNKSESMCKTEMGDSTATTLAKAIDNNTTGILAALTAIIFPEGDVLIMADVVAEWVVKNLLPWIMQNVSLEIICDPARPPGLSFVIVGEKPLLRLTYNLYPQIDCAGGSGVNIQDVLVSFKSCGAGNVLTDLTVPSIVGPSGETSVELFQLIVDKLSNLERCCQPCPTTEIIVAPGIRGVGSAIFPTVGVNQVYDNLHVIITAQAAQILAEFSNPPRWKYGSFAFIYADGTLSNPQFINYTGQRLFVPRREVPCVGMTYHMADDVIADVYGVSEPIWAGGVVYP